MWEPGWVPSSCSSAAEGAAGTVSQPCFGRMVIQVCWELLSLITTVNWRLGFPLCPPLVWCLWCCLGERGWCQGECKVTVPCLWGSESEDVCEGRWMMCLELVHVCFTILPAGTSLGLCFMSSMCLGFWWASF